MSEFRISWNESELSEKPAIEQLVGLGWQFREGTEVSPEGQEPERDSYRDVVLAGRLEAALQRINPWISAENLHKVLRGLTHIAAEDTMAANEAFYETLVRYTSVKQDLGTGLKNQTVKIVDFENVDNNDFLVVSQFKVAGPKQNIKPDLVLFVNGLPLVVIECKSPNLTDPFEEAWDQLGRYQNIRGAREVEGAPRLFEHNMLVIATCGQDARYGAVHTPAEFFQIWKDPYPLRKRDMEETLGREPNAQEVLIQGMLSKPALLDIIRNFMVFEPVQGRMVKKVCRYQQFRAVNKTLARIRDPKSEKRGGVIWHTQGSGKSLTMLFLAVKLRHELGNVSILIVTDRIDLDKQITGTFRRCGFPNPSQARSVKNLKELLTAGTGATVMTTVQKFLEEEGGKYPLLSEASDIYVMADEAHRSQYKSLGTNLRTALPNAFYLAFTGTPLEKADKHTAKTFGSYIDTYDILQAVEDEATVPIKYEGRMPDLHVEGESLDAIFDRVFAAKSDKEREAIKQRYANQAEITKAPQRIEKIALDIVGHYDQFIRPDGFKAMVVAVSREAAVMYYDYLRKFNGPESAVVISGDHNDSEGLRAHHKSKAEIDGIIERFLKPASEDPLSVLVVCDMLLTGFDAPIAQVMYLDSPLKEHNLLQAIARVNRKYAGKHFGLIVDYFGVSSNLRDALQLFSEHDVDGCMTPLREELPRLQSYHRAALRFFTSVDMNNHEACLAVLKPEDVRHEFSMAFKKFATSMNMLMPDPVVNPYRSDLKRLGDILHSARNRYRDEQLNIAGCGEKVRELIAQAIRARGVDPLTPPVDILNPKFAEIVAGYTSEEAKASEMEHALKKTITVKLDENPEFYTSLRQRLEELIAELREERMSTSEFIKEVQELIDKAKGVAQEAAGLGMTQAEFAFFRSLSGELVDAGRAEKNVQALAQELVKDLEELAVLDWTVKDQARKDMEKKIGRMLLAANCPDEKVEPLILKIMDLCRVWLKK